VDEENNKITFHKSELIKKKSKQTADADA